MSDLFASGRIIDIILLLVLVEAAALAVWLRGRGGLGYAGLCFNLAAGFALMLAVRLALTGSGWPAIAGCLAAALVAHLLDLRARLRG